jgi:DUF4097 and DUF4098 domain-containing protein YvlB
VCGAAQNDLTYALKVRLKAGNEAEAQRLLRGFGVRTARQGGYTTLVVAHGLGTAELNVKAPRSLREVAVGTSEGAVEVCDLDGSARAETGGGRLKADRIRGDVVLGTAGGEIVLDNVGGSARAVTAGGRISAGTIRGEAVLETGGGDIAAQEIGGAVRAATGGGGIRIERAGAAVVASTGGGPIHVGEARGMVTARNSGGPLQVGAAAGVSCELASGGVRLQNVSGSLRVATAFGSIIAHLLSGQPLTESFLSTANGDITVFIPSNLGVTIRARNDSSGGVRRIVSDFPGIAVRMEGGEAVAEGALNGGGALLRISGTGGTIFLKRQ